MGASSTFKAEIVSIGTELLLGTITDTNATYLAQRLAAAGIDCYYVSQVGDNLGRIVEVLRRAWERSNFIVTTGGLGPTQDDLTREAISALLEEDMVLDPELERHLLSLYSRRGMQMPESNKKQATLIPSASAISNPVGTAPGWWVRRTGSKGAALSGVRLERQIISMPGVPFEMKRMWEREVEPNLAVLAPSVIVSHTLKVMGLGESRVEEIVADLMRGNNPTLAPYAKSDGIHLRLTAKADARDTAETMLAPLEKQVRSRLGAAIYGSDGDTPQSAVRSLLDAAGLTFILLEIGDGALGSVVPLLGGHELCLGALGGHDLQTLGKAVDGDDRLRMAGEEQISGNSALLPLVDAILRRTGGDLALVVEVGTEAMGTDGSSLQFTAELALFYACSEKGIKRVSYSWRTTPSEVGRLVGLAALNHLRHSLLASIRNRGRGLAI